MERISGGVKTINTLFINVSDRYKHMRVFYCNPNVVPSEAFRLNADWTMDKWIKGNGR